MPSEPFDLQPILQGALLELRPLRADDFDELFSVAADPLIWEQHPEPDRHTAAVFRRFFDDQLASGGGLLVLDARTGAVVGTSRFHGYHGERAEVEIGWTFLARSHWGGVYNRELKELMLRHAFRSAQSVVFLVGPQNVRSQRAVEKLGAVRIGLRADGGRRESVAYEITASTFERLF